ncbi:MAG: methylmalonyl Co-A mutase-associated GTPase MeaB [Chloroflexi bacterium]|jgi:LAO/AO transport system kinase|nr:methylmalonyl Co-A mutase-associated GTPase MeaB [Anaerolineaceae bacterium]NLI44571.1 methylmalonyl Co-A mutase-associated GTPase MeaB [Chloroflexota bacterium]HOE35577.1 methylmalonyl Co-A mutase-associated GTPase MeaB [Anaerolineaceae bacterium]HOT26039.1 methylmalonyl Co-A mutase-associated GTPase MeaB [Anaerolineaceae bacterium]HQH58281.1 methylmalonyl Co-A mutase-associated GTPase MeaB [Anaerolineaceae bacterium]
MTDFSLETIRKGDKLALSRVLSRVEADHEAGRAALDALFPFTGSAHKIGITGAPGSGKSSLVNALAHHLRRAFPDARVAIIAVDPTSPFTGGAILGDRVRMPDLQNDPGIFIRSMATRGALGGLADATLALSQVFDAAGYEYIIIETVGAGQAEVDIVNLAHTTIVVDTPGMGDDIQTIKAGILEIADILVVNKADLPGADQTYRNLAAMIEMGYRGTGRINGGHHRSANAPTDRPEETRGWVPPVLKTTAVTAQGIADLMNAILQHQTYLRATNAWHEKENAAMQLIVNKLVLEELSNNWKQNLAPGLYESVLRALRQREISPRAAARALLAYNSK